MALACRQRAGWKMPFTLADAHFFFFFFSQHKQSVASQAYTGINGLNYRQIKSLWLWQVNSLPAQSCNAVSLRKYAFIVFICWHGALFCLSLCRAHLI